MQPVIVQPDVELWVTTFLRAQLPLYGFPVGDGGVRVSNKYAGGVSEVVVRRDGGPRLDVVREAARLGINVYVKSDTDKPVSDLARTVAALLCASADGAPVVKATQMSGPSPIPDAASPRRFMTFELTIRGSVLAPTP